MTLAEVTALTEEASRQGRILGVRLSGKRIKGYDSLGYRCATASPGPFP
jgi:hypothetical protein